MPDRRTLLLLGAALALGGCDDQASAPGFDARAEAAAEELAEARELTGELAADVEAAPAGVVPMPAERTPRQPPTWPPPPRVREGEAGMYQAPPAPTAPRPPDPGD